MLDRDTRGAVELVRLDVGRANALDLEAVEGLRGILRECEAQQDIRALLISGRPGIFCAGLDAEVVRGGGDEARALLDGMDALVRELLASRLRIVSCVTGHAVAAGAMFLLCSDLRIGAKGQFRIGFSEVGIGLPLPELPVRLARQRLNRRWFESATLLGRLFSPAEAVDVGFLDWVEGAKAALPAAIEAAEGLAKLSDEAYLGTISAVRADLLRD